MTLSHKKNTFKSRYDHLNSSDPLIVKLSMDELAEEIVNMNYGTVRFLAALIRARKNKYNVMGFVAPERDKLNEGIEQLLQDDYF